MKAISKLLLLALALPFFSFAQEAEEGPKRNRVELTYIKVKVGEEQAFEKAVASHNEKYHKSGTPYSANLNYIRAGKDAGMYVWAMGGFTYADLDEAPGAGDHAKDCGNTRGRLWRGRSVDLCKGPICKSGR